MNKRFFVALPLVLLTLLCVTATSLLAQVTPAGTQIRNRSTATYEDLGGNSYVTQSNEVITVVLPVYGVSILPDDSGETPPVTPALTQNALPGMTVTYRYDLTNNGNDTDDFNVRPLVDAANTTIAITPADVTIYRDLNGNGIVDLGEPAVSTGGLPGSLGAPAIPSGGTVSLIVSYTVPAGASAGDVAYVGVEGASANDPGQIDTRNYHRTNVVNDAVMSANLSAAPPVVFDGDQISYSFSGTNSGNDVANGVFVASVGLTGVLIYDVLPTNPNDGNPYPVFGAPAGTPVGGTVLYLPSGSSTAGSPESWAWSTTPAAGDIAVAYITSGGIAAGQSYTFNYQVTVPGGMPAMLIPNTASLAYVDNDGGTPDPTIVVSNNAAVILGVSARHFIGPQGDAQAGTGPAYNDDITTLASASANSSVDFVNTVRNAGNATDQINIILDGLSSIPPSWSVLFFQSDGITPLVDNGTDGIVDVGPLAAGDSVDVVVRLVIPGTQPAGGPFSAVIRAQSTNDPGVTNLTTDRITTVTPAAVNIGNYDGVAGTTNDAGVNQNANAGTTVDFALDVINPSTVGDTYSLGSAFPAGWTVTYYIDANSNGALDAGENTPVASTGAVAGGAEVNLIARVNVPVGTLPGVNSVSFTATSSNNPGQSDTIGNTVTVNATVSVDFAPDNSGSATPGGTVVYAHTVTNTGNVAETFNLTYASSQGWSYIFYDALSTPITSVTLAAGASVNITVQLTVPAGTPLGTIETGTLTATDNTTGTVSDDAVDVTVIIAGNLQLTKSVSPAGDQVPGTDLVYTVDYQNIGADDLTNIVVYDAIPSFTHYSVGSETTGTPPATVTAITVEWSNDGGATWTYTPVSGGGGALAGYDANVTNVRWVFTGDVVAGASSTAGIGFTVRIIAE